ncbi:12062_t:CDS:2 [Racocetra fulgida]|uniref:12062_t:CDS:1 n=1 Tax=Racocetra fulgida TaxID=60492 RepID=A0A9N9AUJ9_9GLOM|nr:12062_t:CDS:2 [Racocetra fulgida]
MNGKDCRRCLALLSQIEQKDAIIEKYRKITKYQSDLIQDLSHGGGNFDLTPPILSYDNEFLTVAARSTGKYVVSRSYYRTYIGPLTDDIDKETLKQSLEASFGPIDSLDFIPGKGPIIFWPSDTNSKTVQWFAYIDCNSNSTVSDMITAQGNGSSAIVLYSTKDESCTTPSYSPNIKIPVFNEKYSNCQPPNVVIRGSNKTGSHSDGGPFYKPVRSQQDPGVISNNDSGQSQKHVGIAKTVLESFPVYLFSLRNNPDANKDLESGKDIKDTESKEMQIDDKNNIPLNELSQETNGSNSNNSISNKVTEEQLTCPICLGDFESGEELRILPCHHQYHTSCIDPWLLEISTLCPMCKADYTSWNEEASTSQSKASTTVVPTTQNESDATTSQSHSSHAFPHFRWIKYLTSARRARSERRRNRRPRNGHSDNANQNES